MKTCKSAKIKFYDVHRATKKLDTPARSVFKWEGSKSETKIVEARIFLFKKLLIRFTLRYILGVFNIYDLNPSI